MKAYLSITGVIMGLMSVVHVWRAIEEWPHGEVTPWFLVGMGLLIFLPAVFALWAWLLLRKMKRAQKDAKRWHNMD